VDEVKRAGRDSAVRVLTDAGSGCGYAVSRASEMAERTRAAMGTGHPEGDRIVRASAQALACLGRARAAVGSAAAAAARVDVMVWVDDSDSDG
jgi:hypothetical protein